MSTNRNFTTISPGSRNPSSGSYGSSGEYENYPSSHFAEVSEGGTISDQVRNSQAYKTAYALFSSLSDKSWLNRLLVIPTSVQDASSTWFDEQGLSNKYNDKQQANYQYCIQQIQNLMAEYYAWKNSLPITQVEQAQNAGFNSAITGNGVGSSEMNPTMLQSDPSVLQSGSALEQMSSFVGAMTSLTGGFTDIVNTGVNLWKNIEDLNLRREDQNIRQRDQLFGFATYLSERGIDLNNVISGDFVQMLDDFNSSPYSQYKWSETENNLTKETIRSGFLQSFDTYSKDIMKDLAQLSYDTFKADYEYRIMLNKYNTEYFDTLNPNNMAQYDEKSAMYNAEMSKLSYDNESKFRDMYWKIVDKWKKKADKGSWLHQQLLSQLLTGYNPFSFGYNALTTPAKDFMNMGNQAVNTAIKGTVL